MKIKVAIVSVLLVIVSCAQNVPELTSPDTQIPPGLLNPRQEGMKSYSQHMVWGEYILLFNENHTSVDVIPQRQGRFHLNTLKFLEEYCADCLEITSIHNNGDGTIDLSVRITHPFPDNPEYTGFDVKGIIMFNGSHLLPYESGFTWPYGESGNPNYFHVSWAEVGDPEVLNADGYTPLWSPWWDSGVDEPIFNYWQGQYASGTPTANLNAYLNFYSDEERHMFRVDSSVVRTYKISLPLGPVTAGYAIDACWAPSDVTPVTDPLNDFPVSANQEEPWFFRYVVNNDQPITDENCCSSMDCDQLRVVMKDWYGEYPKHLAITFHPGPNWQLKVNSNLLPCDCEVPPGEIWLLPSGQAIPSWYESDGNYRGVAVIVGWKPGFITHSTAYCVFDYTIDIQ